MKENNRKKTYSTPELICIQLDNEISLALESNPPFGPEETLNTRIIENNINNVFKIDKNVV